MCFVEIFPYLYQVWRYHVPALHDDDVHEQVQVVRWGHAVVEHDPGMTSREGEKKTFYEISACQSKLGRETILRRVK